MSTAFRKVKTAAQPLAVDFIDNRMPAYHSSFTGMATRYDASKGSYLPAVETSTMAQDFQIQEPIRPEPSEVMKMMFWDTIFAPAMEALKREHPDEPKKRAETGYSIRDLPGWNAVQQNLKQAQESFEHPPGVRGYLGSAMRKGVDHSQKLTGAINLVPEMDTTSAVLSVVKGLLRVIQVPSTFHSYLFSLMSRPRKIRLSCVRL